MIAKADSRITQKGLPTK